MDDNTTERQVDVTLKMMLLLVDRMNDHDMMLFDVRMILHYVGMMLGHDMMMIGLYDALKMMLGGVRLMGDNALR